METEILEQIAKISAQEIATAEAVAQALGTVTQDFGSNMWVQPTNKAFSEANITRAVDRKSLHSINLTLSEPYPLADFLDMYPDAELYVEEDDAPEKYGVWLDTGDTPFIIKLFATVTAGDVIGYTLLRDIRL